MVPAPQEFLSGCRFHPRCAYARSTDCVTDLPQLREISSGHFVRCHYAGALDAGALDAGALDQMQSAPPVALHAQTQAEQKGGS
jgi:peptide/nickel transport system ATP-binding protein